MKISPDSKLEKTDFSLLNPEECNPLVTAKSLARVLSLKESYVRDFSGPSVPEDQRIPSIRIGKRLIRYSLPAVLAWITDQQNEKPVSK